MMKYPLTDQFRSSIKPISNLLLLWTEGENVSRKKIIATITTQDAIDTIRRPGDIDLLQLVFVEKALNGLS